MTELHYAWDVHPREMQNVDRPLVPDDPVRLPATGKLAMHQYPLAGDICGASPVSVELMVGDDHPLNKFKPTSLLWAAQARNLSFAGFTVAIE